MILFDKTRIYGWEAAVRGMRNPMNSWDRSDSSFDGEISLIGVRDYDLMQKLADAGPVHGKYMRMITVTTDIVAPLYWWKEFDTYKVGTVSNSCSTMHKIHAKEFELDDFSHEHLHDKTGEVMLKAVIDYLNHERELYLASKSKDYWWNMVQMLPSSYKQKRTIMLNYAVLKNIYEYRKDHKLDEWQDFCRWIRSLPHSELITGRE